MMYAYKSDAHIYSTYLLNTKIINFKKYIEYLDLVIL